MTEALITKKMLTWARTRYRLSVESAATKLKVTPATLADWESEWGASYPSFKQARTIAQKFNIPFGYLYLSDPPSGALPLPDFRIVGGSLSVGPSPDLLDLLDDIQVKQRWYRDYREHNGGSRVAFIGRFDREEPFANVAKDIRKTLAINDSMRREATTWDGFLSQFARRVEAAGVLVLRSGIVGNNTSRKLNVDEFRGFAISDEYAPLIFINASDAKAAQIFTLAHELAHLWYGETGISNPDYRRQSGNAPERLCSRVAAEVLLPEEDFVGRWASFSTDNIEAILQQLATYYKVSRIAILIQAHDLDLVPDDTFGSLYDKLLSERGNGKKGGGDFYRNVISRNGITLTTAVLNGLAQGDVLDRDAARLLNVNVGHLDRIAQTLG